MSEFEVIGYEDEEGWDDDDDDDEVGVDVMGYSGPMGGFEASAVVGYDDYGHPLVVGAPRRRRRGRRGRRRARHHAGRHSISVARPKWRGSQLAPGVIAPDQGMLTLPLTGTPSNTFSLTQQATTFVGQVQKPFRAERLLVSTVRTGTSAVGRLLGLLFNGTDLQQLDITRFDIEQLGSPNAFGVRLATKPVQPGVLIRLDVTLSTALTTTDTIFTSVQLLGRNVH